MSKMISLHSSHYAPAPHPTPKENVQIKEILKRWIALQDLWITVYLLVKFIQKLLKLLGI